jgi:putative peptidoglycan lipid II flippase
MSIHVSGIIKPIMGEERGRIARAAGLMSVATFMSRVLGYVRDMTLAFFFGASGLSDAFFVAFKIPNLMRELFAEGAMSSAVIPVLTGYQKEGPAEARRLVSVVLGLMLVLVGAVSVLGFIFAPAIVSAIAPGFLADAEKFETTVLLARVMVPFLLLVSLASLQMAALNTRRVFFIPALSPATTNIAIILAVALLAGRLERPVLAAAIGVTLGGLLQIIMQAPLYVKQGYSMRPRWNLRHPGLRRILSLIVPVTVGMAVSQVGIVVNNILASFLPAGSVTYLFYSMRLIQFPIGMFGVAMGMAVLPSLSAHAVEGRMDRVGGDYAFALRLIMFISLPAMAGLIALSVPIVATLFQRGAFDASATAGTARALLYYSLGVWAVVGVKVTASTFYATGDTRTPVKCAVAALSLNIGAGLLLMGPMGHSGLALAHAMGSTLNFVLLFVLLRRKLGRLGTRAIGLTIGKAALASGVMCAAGLGLLSALGWDPGASEAARAGRLGAAILASGTVYFIIGKLLGAEEMDFLLGIARRRLARKEN